MKLLINTFNSTALNLAIEKQNIEIVKLILTKENLDVNIICICYYKYLIKFYFSIFNSISSKIIL